MQRIESIYQLIESINASVGVGIGAMVGLREVETEGSAVNDCDLGIF